MKNIRQGNIIKGLNWPEPVEIKFIEETEGYIHIVGVTTISQSHIDQLISQEEFSKLSVVGTEITCSEDPGKVFLALEATRYQFASLYDPLLAMNTSKIDPLPHQIEAVYGYENRRGNRRGRFYFSPSPKEDICIQHYSSFKERTKIQN